MSQMDPKHIDDRFQCMVHQLRKDTDWVNLRRSIVRAPQILKQKLNAAGELLQPDPEFDAFNAKFSTVELRVKSLEIELNKYVVLTKLLAQHSTGLAESFGKVFDPHSTPEGSALSGEKFEMCMALSQKDNEISDKIHPNCELILNNVKEPVSRLVTICKNIKRNVDEREFTLLDVNKYLAHLRTLNLKDKVTLSLKQEQNLVRYQKNLELCQIKYDAVNNQFKSELPVFFGLVDRLVRPLHIVFYYLQLTIHYQLLSLNEITSVNFKLRSKEVDMDLANFAEHITQQFHRNHDSTAVKIKRLSISKGPLERKFGVDCSFQEDLEDDHQSSIRTAFLLCTLKYSYVAEQDGDLSFEKGDMIKILDQRFSDDWWKGELGGCVGIFPKNYVVVL